MATAPPTYPPVQIYGSHYSRMRIKWSCPSCGKRNDCKLPMPVSEKEARVCKFCHKAAIITFTEKKVLEPAPEVAP